MYYFLKADSGENYENIIVFGILYNSKAEIVEDIFDEGVSLESSRKSEDFTIVVNEKESSKGKWADTVRMLVTNAGSIFIATDKACDLFQKLGLKNLEYFNVTIKTKKESLTNYKVVNVVGKIDCLDENKSDVTFRTDGSIKKIKKLYFNEEKIPKDLKMFLLGRKNVARIIVHETIKQAIEENLSGFSFTHINEYKDR